MVYNFNDVKFLKLGTCANAEHIDRTQDTIELPSCAASELRMAKFEVFPDMTDTTDGSRASLSSFFSHSHFAHNQWPG